MGTMSLQRDVVSCNAVVNVCAKKAQWERGFVLLSGVYLKLLSSGDVTRSLTFHASKKEVLWESALNPLMLPGI